MKETLGYIPQEGGRFSKSLPNELVAAISDKRIRSYKDSDYEALSSWMVDLGKFYDGHSEDNKLLDQLVGTEKADKAGFFTKNKFMFICEVDDQPAGMICLNYKRGGSTKIGPVIVNPEIRGQGVGTSLLKTAEEVGMASGSRKLYATTSHLNEPINHLFVKMGYKIEAKFPDQYKKGSIELIWGKHLEEVPILSGQEIESVLFEEGNPTSIEIDSFAGESIDFINNTNSLYQQWHDDLGSDFVEGMIAGVGRGLDFQNKGKIILLARSGSEIKGMVTFTPKRGGPVKLYPFCGTPSAQKSLIESAKAIAKKNNNHKLYTFVHSLDIKQLEFLESEGFSKRGEIESPYKLGHNLIPLDIFIK